MSASTLSDTRVRALLPEFDTPIPPVTRRRLRRASAVYAVLWLCGENARSITGQAIAVAGGEI